MAYLFRMYEQADYEYLSILGIMLRESLQSGLMFDNQKMPVGFFITNGTNRILSPAFAEFARRVRYDNLLRNVSVSTLRYAVGSTSRFCSHLLWGLLREAFEVLTVACRTVCMALTAAVCFSEPVCHLFCMYLSIVRQSLGMLRAFEQFGEYRGHLAIA